ncbi:hypothetical protein BDW59DRAFT_173743 [Aspergillus cavernicola]|uniref:F-box domain-containing protein n=1 Tax=Aspergillus cavernicola TaxID=176166 RepID=A0ABR4I4X8_9EURO
MDPFGQLPWFALQNILSNLDLPSLHSLHNASPEVMVFLHRNHNLFTYIIDAIIENTARERGLMLHVQHAVRLIIFVWTRQSSHKSAVPVQEPDTDILGSLQLIREQSPYNPSPIWKTISPSTPSAILCQLLSLMTRLRCLTHAYFHSTISKCLQIHVEHLPKKTKYILTRGIVDPSQRPPGIPYTPVDIGPPTWLEEQRLLAGLLCIVLFYELRKTNNQVSSDDNVEGFWTTVFERGGQVEQIATLLHWLDGQASGHAKVYSWLLSGKGSEDYNRCCQRYTSMTDKQWVQAEIDLCSWRSSRGMQSLWRCYSPFRPYGVVFWDGIRMDALGLPEAQYSHYMWFTWSFMLTEEDWEEIRRRQGDPSFDRRR